ncbi:MAG: LexA family transcriptional regulator [Candidatus Riflebacteria bacterium]|nr:LexA family transcriptional regulator [Candidatus Riflebacteria bacterium]
MSNTNALSIEIGQRIEQVRGKLSQKSFAKLLSIGQNTVSQYERGERTPQVHVVLKICDVFEINFEWLLTGGGAKNRFLDSKTQNTNYEQPPSKVPTEEPEREAAKPKNSKKLIKIPLFIDRYLIRDCRKIKPQGYIIIRKDHASEIIRGDLKDLIIVRMITENMEPTIRSGEIVLVRAPAKWPLFDGIYLLGNEHGLNIRRIQNISADNLSLSYDNKKYKDILISKQDLLASYSFLGRVYGTIRNL